MLLLLLLLTMLGVLLRLADEHYAWICQFSLAMNDVLLLGADGVSWRVYSLWQLDEDDTKTRTANELALLPF